MDDESLREMYANLLASSMQKDKKKSVRPSFVDVVKNLSPDEAKILRRAYALNMIPTISAGWKYREVGKGEVMQIEWFSTIAEEAGAEYPSDVISYLDNLVRLGLLERVQDKFFTQEARYENLEKHIRIQAIKEETLSMIKIGHPVEFKIKKGIIRMTEFGCRFCEVCLPQKSGSSIVDRLMNGRIVGFGTEGIFL